MDMLAQWIVLWTIVYVWSTTFMLLRLYLRWTKQALRITDLLTAITLILSTLCYALSIWCGYLMLKVPGKFLRVSQLSMSFFFLNLSLTIIVPLTKGCVVLLLQEVETNWKWRRALCIIHGLLGLQTIGILIMNFFGCVQVYPGIVWSILVKNHYIVEAANQLDQRSCIPRTEYIIINGVLNVLIEIVILICAFSLILRVKLTKAQRIGLAITFGLGIFPIPISIVSTVYLFKAHENWLERIDPATGGAAFFKCGIWSCMEVYGSLTLASILPIRATLLQFYYRLLRFASRFINFKQEADHRHSVVTMDTENQCEEIIVNQTDILFKHGGEKAVEIETSLFV